MRFLVYSFAIAALMALYGFAIFAAYGQDAQARPIKVRYCDAPCTVVLPPGTLEDEFTFNYGWKRLSDWDGEMRWYPIVHVKATRGEGGTGDGSHA